MKEFVVGSPYTTETTLGPDDDFLIIACDGVRLAFSAFGICLLTSSMNEQLWDVCEDQEAVDIIHSPSVKDPQAASQALLDFALGRFSSDNLSVLVVALTPRSKP